MNGPPMTWFQRDFDDPRYFEIYRNKEAEAAEEGPALAAYLGLPRGSRVLDLPCGWGRLRPYLVSRGYRVAGGDLSALNLARHFQEQGGAVVRMDLRNLPFRDACADGVFCAFTSWGYFATDEENLAQLLQFYRVLRPGGVLLLDLCGRVFLERAVDHVADRWYEVEGYKERVRWKAGRRRVLTDRILDGERFQHDIWIPGIEEVMAFLQEAGFSVDEAWGGLNGEPWHLEAERWIFRVVKR